MDIKYDVAYVYQSTLINSNKNRRANDKNLKAKAITYFGTS